MKIEKQRQNKRNTKIKNFGIYKKSAPKMRKYQTLYKNIFVKLYLLELNKTVPIYRKVIELMITRNCYNLL